MLHRRSSAYGGTGSIGGVIIGASLLVSSIGHEHLGTSSNHQKIVKGLVLLFAVLFDVLPSKRKEVSREDQIIGT